MVMKFITLCTWFYLTVMFYLIRNVFIKETTSLHSFVYKSMWGDRYWRQNMLVTTVRCWLRLWPFWYTTSGTNIQKSSPASLSPFILFKFMKILGFHKIVLDCSKNCICIAVLSSVVLNSISFLVTKLLILLLILFYYHYKLRDSFYSELS